MEKQTEAQTTMHTKGKPEQSPLMWEKKGGNANENLNETPLKVISEMIETHLYSYLYPFFLNRCLYSFTDITI